jgi:hypothetical protein
MRLRDHLARFWDWVRYEDAPSTTAAYLYPSSVFAPEPVPEPEPVVAEPKKRKVAAKKKPAATRKRARR